MMRRYWTWIAVMVAVAWAGSALVRSLAFAMLIHATPDRYHGFITGLSLPLAVLQVAPHWYAIVALWSMLAVLAACGWQAARAIGESHRSTTWPVLLGFTIVGVMLTFFAVTLSIDGYYYVFFGRLFGLYGVDPYALVAPITINDAIFAQEFPLLHNPPFPDPYGPGFTLFAGLVAKLEAGASLWAQLWTWRIISLAGCLLILAAVARMLANAAPGERARKLAMVAFNPLTLYEGAAGGHNDVLMIAAATWAYAIVDELPLIAGLLLGLAISIKYFAAVLLPFVAVRAARKNIVAAALILIIALGVPLLCFHPFTLGLAGRQTLEKVGSSLSMSPNWLLALPLFAAHAGNTLVRSVQLAILTVFAVVVAWSIAGYARSPRNSDVFRSITAMLWALPALHPWYLMWLVSAGAAGCRAWAAYAWWFCTLSLLIYAHEAVLPTPVNHLIFIIITVVVLLAPIAIARGVVRAGRGDTTAPDSRTQEGARA